MIVGLLLLPRTETTSSGKALLFNIVKLTLYLTKKY